MARLNKNGREAQENEKVCADDTDGKYKVLFSKKYGFFDPVSPAYRLGDEFSKHEITKEPEYTLKHVNMSIYEVYVEYLRTKRPHFMTYLRNLMDGTH